jgi:hypothetical protein
VARGIRQLTSPAPSPTLPLMADEADNIVLEHLRHIRGQLDAMRADISELKTTQAGILQILAASQSHALRIDEKLARIEARLGLVDSAIP